jgi:hypothetical protein
MADTKFINNLLLGEKLVVAELKNPKDPKAVRAFVRPVEIKGERNLQISILDGKKDITKNFYGRLARQKIGELVKLGFREILIQTKEENIRILVSDKGKVQMTKRRVEIRELSTIHNRKKHSILDPDKRYEFLVAIGVQNQDGTTNAEHRKKFTQINEFLKVIKETIDASKLKEPVQIVDFGCGNAYITFALHYYFAEIIKMKVETIGVDLQTELVKRNNQRAEELGWKGLSFVESPIEKYKVLGKPTIVLSLHACDTATDDALAKGINFEASYIFAVPCCHKNIQQNLPKSRFPSALRQIASHGILLQRTCDIVTDTFRALILRITGYKTDVFEFVDSTHSAKNIMIRGVKLPHAVDVKTYTREYEDLKKFWGVSPYLESLTQI